MMRTARLVAHVGAAVGSLVALGTSPFAAVAGAAPVTVVGGIQLRGTNGNAVQAHGRGMMATGKLMDVSGGSLSNGANVIQWGDNGGPNQQWQVVLAN